MAQTLVLTFHADALGGEVITSEAEVVEAISRPTTATVRVLCENEIDADAIIGQPARLDASLDGAAARSFHLVVTAVAYEGTHRITGYHHYTVELHHALHLLTLRADVQMFQEKDAQEIMAQVLDDARVEATFSLTRKPDKRVYCVQYRETDFAFISRLAEHEGIFYVIRHDDAAAELVFADSQSAFEPVDEGDGGYRLTDDDKHGVGIHDFWLEATAAPEKATVCDYDFEAPKTDLTMHEQIGDVPRGDHFEYAVGFTKQDQGKVLAKIRLEELRVWSVRGAGRSDRMALRAGAWFELLEASRDALATKYLLDTVEHRFVARVEGGATPGDRPSYENSFTCVLHEKPFRPRRLTPRAHVGGLHSAVVTGPGGEIHTDVHGRMKGKFFWDRVNPADDTSSTWMRVAQLPIGNSQALARMTWEMAIAYVHGDPDRPVAVARLYNAEKPSPYAYPGAATRMSFQTPSSPASGKSNELRMEDGGGGMEMFINATKSYDLNTVNNKTETIGVNEKREVGISAEINVGANQTVTVGGNETVTVSKDEGVGVKADRSTTVGGSETLTVSGDISIATKGSDTETTGGSHTTLAAMGVTHTSKGSYALSVGGSMVSAAGLGVSVAVAGAKAETIGGVYLVASGKVVTETVIGAMAKTVGGVIAQSAAGSRLGTTTGACAITVGGLVNCTAATKLVMKAASVNIKVAGTANLLGGGGILNLTPGSAAFTGLVMLDASGSIKISGNPNLVG